MACASSGVNAPLAMSAAPRLTELRLHATSSGETVG
jgi:hypothetical protein